MKLCERRKNRASTSYCRHAPPPKSKPIVQPFLSASLQMATDSGMSFATTPSCNELEFPAITKERKPWLDVDQTCQNTIWQVHFSLSPSSDKGLIIATSLHRTSDKLSTFATMLAILSINDCSPRVRYLLKSWRSINAYDFYRLVSRLPA